MSVDKQKLNNLLAEVKKRKQNKTKIETKHQKVEIVIFTLNNNYYAFLGKDIKEILNYEKITFVPGCPEQIIGIINVRGDIESVVNIHKLMEISKPVTLKSSRIIIAEKNGIRSGILVDSVEDVISIPSDIIKKPIATLKESIKKFALGGETFYHQKYITIIDIEKLFSQIIP